MVIDDGVAGSVVLGTSSLMLMNKNPVSQTRTCACRALDRLRNPNSASKDIKVKQFYLGGGGHSNGISDTSSERSSGGLNAGGVVLGRWELGVTGSHGVVATEILHLLEGKGVAGKVEP